MFENAIIASLVTIIVILISLIGIINAADVSLRREMEKRYIDVCNDAFKDGYERGRAVRKL